MNKIALIVSVIALIVSVVVWAINSPPSPFYDEGEAYLNDVGIGTENPCNSENFSDGNYIIICNDGTVGMGDGMSDDERVDWERTKRQDTSEWKYVSDYWKDDEGNKYNDWRGNAGKVTSPQLSLWQNTSNLSEFREVIGLHAPQMLIVGQGNKSRTINIIAENRSIVNLPTKIIEIRADEEPLRIRDSITNMMDSNATVVLYNVGKNFHYRKVIMNLNQTRVIIKGKGIVENAGLLIWDRENNTVVIE